MNNQEKLYLAAKESLGMDMSKVAPDELGCADSVNQIHIKAFGEPIATPGISTTQLYEVMKSDPRFEEVPNYLAGDIIISPTGYSSKGSTHGHCGICGLYGIMSNDSYTGTFRENFTIDGWRSYFASKEGFPVVFFRRK